MNREMLFRGKRIDDGEWIEGDLIHSKMCEYAYIVVGFDFASKCQELGRVYAFKVDKKTIGQFTGLIDKNGKKIFENDVVHHGDSSELCFVAYKEAGFYCVPASKERHVLPLEMWLSACAVIGNIWDNPELVTNDE